MIRRQSMQTYAIILAAGQGTRMKSKLYKVLHPVCGKPMVKHVLEQTEALQAHPIVTIVGCGAEQVKDALGTRSLFVLQENQLGTAHAVLQAEEVLGCLEGITFVVCGDTPLITSETMSKLRDLHIRNQAKATVLTAIAKDPTGYGRVIRTQEGLVKKIVEHKDANSEERAIREINTGIYCFDNQLLFKYLKSVKNENTQGEYYLPDVIELMKADQLPIAAYIAEDFYETLGVNDRIALSKAEQIMQARILRRHMHNGVTIINPQQTVIGADVSIGEDTVIQPSCVLTGQTEIGKDCVIGPNTEIVDCKIGSYSVIKHSACYDSKVGEQVQIGPFAHLRPKSILADTIKIGNFVEIKASSLEYGSKVSHLSYIGDSEIGKNVNIGCGSITVNYDGKNKFKTVVQDNVFIGCNSNLIAPVTIGEGAFVAAGTTVTSDVPEKSLTIARIPQVDKPGYMK